MSRHRTTLPVSACLVTRGDVDMQPIIDSLPPEWEKIVYANGHGCVYRLTDGNGEGTGWWTPDVRGDSPDLAVYGRYAAIEYASHDLIYVQDDDVIVSDPQTIVDAAVLRGEFVKRDGSTSDTYIRDAVVCNMPPEFRPHYPDSGLVGFGAAFHRDAPERAFDRFLEWEGWEVVRGMKMKDLLPQIKGDQSSLFERRCDNVFTTLTPMVLVDVPKTDCTYASDSNRMWRQQGHTSERDEMIRLARRVRDGQ